MRQLTTKTKFFGKSVLTIAFTGVLSATAYAQTFQVGSVFGKENIVTKLAENFAESIENKTAGDMKVRVRIGSPFGDVYQISKQVANGQRKLDVVSMSSDVDHRLAIGYMGGLVSNYQQAEELYGANGKFIDVINEIGKEAGYRMIAWVPSGFGGIVFRQDAPKQLPSDVKYKVRVAPYRGMIARFEALGFNAVPMAYSETYTALQTGSIDAKGATPAQEASTEFADVAKKYLYSRDYFEGIIGIAVNRKWFDSLPASSQNALLEAGRDATASVWEGAEEREEAFLAELQGKGVEVIRLTDEQYAEVMKISRESEWPVLRETVGDEIMDKLEAIAH